MKASPDRDYLAFLAEDRNIGETGGLPNLVVGTSESLDLERFGNGAYLFSFEVPTSRLVVLNAWEKGWQRNKNTGNIIRQPHSYKLYALDTKKKSVIQEAESFGQNLVNSVEIGNVYHINFDGKNDRHYTMSKDGKFRLVKTAGTLIGNLKGKAVWRDNSTGEVSLFLEEKIK